MTEKQIAERLLEAIKGKTVYFSLSRNAVASIENGRNNYPVSRLLSYCNDTKLAMVMKDMATEESYTVHTVLEISRLLKMLMHRYKVGRCEILHKTGVCYTAPNLEDTDGRRCRKGGRHYLSLTIRTLLAVCETIHCDILFEPIDEGSFFLKKQRLCQQKTRR